jgi:predicted permease
VLLDAINALIPVLTIIALGFLVGKKIKSNTEIISKIAFYLLSPALVFSSLAKSTMVSEEVIEIIIFVILLAISNFLLAKFASVLMGFSREKQSALMLSTIFVNSLNYGAPVILFTLGPLGFERAIAFAVVQSILFYSFGIYTASSGKTNWKIGLQNVFKLPHIYVVILAGFLNLFNLGIGEVAMRPIQLLGDSAIPIVLLLLGIQLSRVQFKKAYGFVAVASTIRLIVSPVLGIIIIWALAIEGLTGDVLILQSAMPSAVLATLISIEFKIHPDLVSLNTLVSTLLSLVTLTILISFI